MPKSISDVENDITGVVSLIAAAGSFFVFVGFLGCLAIGLKVSTDVSMFCLAVYAVLLVIALITGFRSRHTRFGKWGFIIAVVWMLFLVLIAYVILLVKP
ncbi:MAG: hypothetical protein V4671_21355 [Armatimonadota bacterium]